MSPLDLAQAGPVAILLVGIGLLYRAFVKGDVVPGSVYRDMVARAEKAETQEQRNSEAIESVAGTMKLALERLERRERAGSRDEP